MSTESLDYIKNRLDDQLQYYENNSKGNKNRYHGFQVLIIVSGALIPIINSIDYAGIEIRVVSAVLGSVILGITSVLQLKKYQENWILYRSTAEVLKKEKQFFLNQVGDYSGLTDERRHKLLVERIEAILSSENTKFIVTHNEKLNKSE